MRFCSRTAIELANALLDAVEISRETGTPCYINKVGNSMVAVDDVDTGFSFFLVDPPETEPEDKKSVAA